MKERCTRHVSRSSAGRAWLVLALLLFWAPGASADDLFAPEFEVPALPTPYWVSELYLEYAEPHPDHPSLENLDSLRVVLGRTQDGYEAPRRGLPAVWFRLGELNRKPVLRLFGSGLRDLNEQIVDALNRMGLMGVYVGPHPDDINLQTGEDLRPAGQTVLRLRIYTGRVRALRTFASGKRIHPEQRLDHPAHRRIRQHSPVRPDGPDARSGSNLLRKDRLEAYVAQLNRHPGRRVDVALTPSQNPGEAYLDYMVAEDKAWRAYAQASNTGTDQTTDWRQRFGFTHNQLTGHDDILRLDYITGSFDSVNAALASYSAPLIGLESTRWELFGSWSQYDASVVGFGAADFEGSQWQAGGKLIRNLLQRGDLFLDGVAGARWLSVESTNLGFTGEEDFLLPQVGLRAERVRPTSTFYGNLGFEMNLPDVAGTSSDETELFLLGRPMIDDDFYLMRWDAAYSFYLEPFFDPSGWANPRSPSTSTLVHEFFVSTRGQYAFGNRLIPQEQQILGGMYTIRGYDQATLAGDSVAMATLEYRYHVPMAFDIQPIPASIPFLGDFRIAPPQVYTRPDWDLILRLFWDVGRVAYSDAVPGEMEETIAGAGLGFELIVRRNLSLRFDWGLALSDTEDGEAKSGDSEAHVSATVLY